MYQTATNHHDGMNKKYRAMNDGRYRRNDQIEVRNAQNAFVMLPYTKYVLKKLNWS